MTREEVLNSISLKKRFCKDCNLPISLYDCPYFVERLIAIDDLYSSLSKWDIFCKELENYSSEQDYFQYYNEVKENIINKIKNSKGYANFISDSSFKNYSDSDIHYPNRDLYIEDNDNKQFISIDMAKANYSSMRIYDHSIFDNTDTWEEFISGYTDNKHIIKSKYIRQVIFGACNPKRQVFYERYLMLELLKDLQKIFNNNLSVFSVSHDEIIIEVSSSFDLSFNQLKDAVYNHPIGQFCRIEFFTLFKLIGIEGWMKEDYKDSKISFHCIPSELLQQVMRYYFNEDITENDLIFYHNGRLARFLEPIRNPLPA